MNNNFNEIQYFLKNRNRLNISKLKTNNKKKYHWINTFLKNSIKAQKHI